MDLSDMHISEELKIVGAEACRWAAASKLPQTTDAELVLAAVDRRGELLEELRAKFPIDRGQFVEQLQKRRPPRDFSVEVPPPFDEDVLRQMRLSRSFGHALQLDLAIRNVVAGPSPALKKLLDSARKAVVPATWLDSEEFWFSLNTPLPGPMAERVANGAFGNDRLASSRELEPYLKDPQDDEHLPFHGVTIIVEDRQKDPT